MHCFINCILLSFLASANQAMPPVAITGPIAEKITSEGIINFRENLIQPRIGHPSHHIPTPQTTTPYFQRLTQSVKSDFDAIAIKNHAGISADRLHPLVIEAMAHYKLQRDHRWHERKLTINVKIY
jgi:hypothetical protein